MTEAEKKAMEKSVWTKTVYECEKRVLSLCPSLTEGKKDKETVEQFAARCRDAQDKALDSLIFAREKLASLS